MLSDAQLKDRINYIGASEAAAVLGLSRWGTPLSVWAEKTGQIVKEDISGRLPVKLGHKLEQTVAELFMEETGKKLHRVNETIFHPTYPFLACNLDRRVVGERAIVQCKTASAWKSREWDGEEIPREYIIQEMHELAVSGMDRAYIAVLIGNQDFKIKTIERDEEALKKLIEKEVSFWHDYVIPKVMPAVTSQDQDTLMGLFPTAVEGKEIELDNSAAAICEVLEGMGQDLKALENQIEGQRNELRRMLKDAESGKSGPWTIKWGNVVGRFQAKELKAQMPEIYEKFKAKATTRKLLIDREDESDGKRG